MAGLNISFMGSVIPVLEKKIVSDKLIY
jgi:hypothetical protein